MRGRKGDTEGELGGTCERWCWEEDFRRKKRRKRGSGPWLPRLYIVGPRESRCSLQSLLVFHPRVQLVQTAPLGLRALQVCRECLGREEQLVLLGPRETE